MQVALMVPCHIDLFYPATLELLEKLKVDVVYPFDQTCCAQPVANSGCYEEARGTEELFIRNFSAFDIRRYRGSDCSSRAGSDDAHRCLLAGHEELNQPNSVSSSFYNRDCTVQMEALQL